VWPSRAAADLEVEAALASAASTSEDDDEGDWRLCEVDHRQLIDKLLAKYAQCFAVIRELVQNANDAEASKVVIMLRLGPETINQKAPAKKAAAAASPQHGESCFSSACFPRSLFGRRVVDLMIWNNGANFTLESLKRMCIIAKGNPDGNKVGMFGQEKSRGDRDTGS
jgi:hypothetical protein